MKKKLFISCMMVLMLSTLYSCKKGFIELNIDPINILHTSPDRLLTPALVDGIWPGMNRNRNFNNELMQVTVNMSDGDNTVFRYAFRSNVSDYLWNNWYVYLNNFRDIYNKASEPEQLNKSYQGIALICESWLFANLTDTYGDIPYFEALQGRDGNVQPKFDRQKDIYLDLFRKLEEANQLLAENQEIKASSDPVYEGDIHKWRKFGNSLYLRLLLRISGKAEVQADCIAKIKEIVTNPAQYPIFESNADCANILWNGGQDTTDPFTNPYLVNVRAQDFRAPAICSFFINPLVAWTDPRLVSGTPYGHGSIGRLGIAQASGGGWVGVSSGYLPGQGEPKGSYFQSYDNTSTGGERSLQQNRLTGIIMQYSEVQFILAEACLKEWIEGDPKDYLYRGIAAAINYWVPNFPESPTSTNFNTYLGTLSEGGYLWDDNASFEDKMELIHKQKYYALFLTDLQQWFEYRRTGHPILPKGPGLQNGGVMPARMVYPVYVQSANPTNYREAVQAQGPDQINTEVWWQRKP